MKRLHSCLDLALVRSTMGPAWMLKKLLVAWGKCCAWAAPLEAGYTRSPNNWAVILTVCLGLFLPSLSHGESKKWLVFFLFPAQGQLIWVSCPGMKKENPSHYFKQWRRPLQIQEGSWGLAEVQVHLCNDVLKLWSRYKTSLSYSSPEG